MRFAVAACKRILAAVQHYFAVFVVTRDRVRERFPCQSKDRSIVGFPTPAVRTKKTAVLVAPPKFREETSKKAARLSASASERVRFAGAACKRILAAVQHFFATFDFDIK